MKYQGKSMMSLNEMAKLAIDYEGDGYVTGYPIVSGDDAYILNGVIEANEEYITINQWVPVFLESLTPVSPSLNDDQQVVLEWLKGIAGTDGSLIKAVYNFYYLNIAKSEIFKGNEKLAKVRTALRRLTRQQEAEVLAVFANYGLEGEG